jgi:hypothetical protein
VMEGAYELKIAQDSSEVIIPLGVEVEAGPNWEELKPVQIER